LLWHDRVIGWGNLAVVDGALRSHFGFVGGTAPDDSEFDSALNAELKRIGQFLRLETA